MGLKTVQKDGRPLAERVADEIAQLIEKNEYKKGERLPNEFQLAESLNVGRGTIREAIKLLASKNIVEIRRGLGTFVTEKTGLVNDPLGLHFVENKERLAVDLMELRMMIEPEIAALAAERASDEDIRKIQEACQAVEQKIQNKQPFTEEDIRFHEAIAESCKNQVVPNVIPVIHSAVRELIKATNAQLTELTIKTHRAVVDAIAQRDPEKARAAMCDHMAYNKEQAENQLQSGAAAGDSLK
jgi:GntR family transcriptional regulator, transcriptional repressor for pyruvate dehydrogenase complex